jgi:CheY-like chemotaxis protein
MTGLLDDVPAIAARMPGSRSVSWAATAPTDASLPPEGGPASVEAAPDGSQARILLVEDELLVAWEVSDQLKGLGHAICGTAATADDAIRMAEEQRPDLILMDVTLLGGRDGIAAATVIQATNPTRIVFVTAHSDPGTQARMGATGPLAILRKPYTEAELAQVVAAALGKETEQ